MKSRWQRTILVLLVSLAFSVAGTDTRKSSSALERIETTRPGQYQVLQIDDGDTITVAMNGLSERVRFIGVDTPELHHPQKPVQCFARAAKSFTADAIGTSRVRLEADPLDDNRDLYGRLLRYVYLPDGKLLNMEIIRAGYGFTYTRFPYTKTEQAQRLEHEARQAKRGLWSECKIITTNGGTETNNE